MDSIPENSAIGQEKTDAQGFVFRVNEKRAKADGCVFT